MKKGNVKKTKLNLKMTIFSRRQVTVSVGGYSSFLLSRANKSNGNIQRSYIVHQIHYHPRKARFRRAFQKCYYMLSYLK